MTRSVSILLFALSGCGVLQLPALYVRGVLSVGSDAALATTGEVGLRGQLDREAPAPTVEPEPMPVVDAGELPCRVALLCAWQDRSVAEARGRVIGGAP